jgi:lipoate-protein ligase B
MEIREVKENGGVIPSQSQVCKTWLCVVQPVLDYADAWRLQVELVAARHAAVVDTDIMLLLEHPPVFTLGRRGGRENLTVSESFLEKSGIPIFHIERGGNITFHGPGQLIGYGIVDLHAAKLTVTDYVTGLEEIMIRTAGHWGVIAERNPINRGVWVGNTKLGSIGIAVRRGITFHGFALNVNTRLEPFSWINPCGLKGIGVTSMERELTQALPITEVREVLKHSIETVFHVKLALTELAAVEAMLREAKVNHSPGKSAGSGLRSP